MVSDNRSNVCLSNYFTIYSVDLKVESLLVSFIYLLWNQQTVSIRIQTFNFRIYTQPLLQF